MCNIEFPHFGASYPDAHCIDGYLWDMDSYEDGCYTIGGYDPCPFCNTDEWLKIVLDNEDFASREEALEWAEKMREMWGANHFHDTTKKVESEIPNDLEEAAHSYSESDEPLYSPGHRFHWDSDSLFGKQIETTFIAGAKWQKEQDEKVLSDKIAAAYQLGLADKEEQMLKEAVEGRICKDEYAEQAPFYYVLSELFNLPPNMMNGDKVCIIIVKDK